MVKELITSSEVHVLYHPGGVVISLIIHTTLVKYNCSSFAWALGICVYEVVHDDEMIVIDRKSVV